MAQKAAYHLLRQTGPGQRSVGRDPVSPQIMTKLREFMSLEPNWDGHQGRATDPGIAEFAVQTLGRIMKKDTPEPILAPGGDGTMQAEWDGDSFSVELHFVSGNKIDAHRKNHGTGEWETVKVSADKIADIADWVESIDSTTTN